MSAKNSRQNNSFKIVNGLTKFLLNNCAFMYLSMKYHSVFHNFLQLLILIVLPFKAQPTTPNFDIDWGKTMKGMDNKYRNHNHNRRRNN